MLYAIASLSFRCLPQGGSENVSFVMHGLHAILVHRGAFDEIVWSRLPPDHSHDAIDRTVVFPCEAVSLFDVLAGVASRSSGATFETR
eukprot:5785824-Pleurochrysis_carterae.AAC.1